MSEEVQEFMMDWNMKRIQNEELLEKAYKCDTMLRKSKVTPIHLLRYEQHNKINAYDDADNCSLYSMSRGDKICMDFGDHYVGYVKMWFSTVGSIPDAPAYIHVRFAERSKELLQDSSDYEGWISRGWIQEEYIHLDVFPVCIRLPRRYAFRFMEIETIDTSLKWKLVVEKVELTSVSAVSGKQYKNVTAIRSDSVLLQRIDKVGLRTLHNCMQEVFEDGPKRDRRLWIGDLRLQALSNYATYNNTELVKKCLYLFAGSTRDDGRIGACIFTKPECRVDDTFYFDYSLFFVSCLWNYYEETRDIDLLRELWPYARKQLILSMNEFDQKDLYHESKSLHSFIDWKAGLEKQAASQAIYIYCAKQGKKIAESLNIVEDISWLQDEIDKKTKAAYLYLWDDEQKIFVSGDQRQISYASQAWMVLAGVMNQETGKKLLLHVMDIRPDMNMVTPYMNHHFTEALFQCGAKEEAINYMLRYWGGMIQEGADTFWELYDPDNPSESPYGSDMVNSYCHAWSCTPVYLLRKYL